MLLTSFQNQVKNSETELATAQFRYRDLDEKYSLAIKDLDTKEQITKELKQAIKQTEDEIIRIIESDELNPKQKVTSTPNGFTLIDKSTALSENSIKHKGSEDSFIKQLKINGFHSITKTNGASTLFQNEIVEEGLDSTHKATYFSTYLSNEENYIEKIIKKQYESKLQALIEKVEAADSQALRFHDAWREVSSRVEKSKKENEELRQQIALLTEQLTRSKDEFEAIETGYKKHIEEMTEQFAEMARK